MRARRFVDLEGHDAYQLIGVPSSASAAEIRQGYRRVMLTAHPDAGGPEDLAKLINCARDVLLRDRTAYDEYRERQAQRAAATEVPNGRDEAGSEEDGSAVPRPASAEDLFAEDDWADDWDEDPWEDAEEGVGSPGQGADSPGAVGDLEDDDQPYRPYRRESEASLWQRLTTPPMLLLSAVILGVAVAATLAQGGSGTSGTTGPRITSNVTVPVLPTRLLPADLYPTAADPLSSTVPYSLPDPYSSLLAVPRPRDLMKPQHKCKIRDDDRLWCNGSNSAGQLGAGDTKSHDKAVQVSGGGRWRSVAVGTSHTCAIRSDRTLWCWGSNSAGQLGIGKAKGSTVPRRVAGDRRWLSVGTTAELSCAVSTGHLLWCWGSTSGSLVYSKGLDPDASRTPQRFGKGITWRTVDSDDSSLCARRPSGHDLCWVPLFLDISR